MSTDWLADLEEDYDKYGRYVGDIELPKECYDN